MIQVTSAHIAAMTVTVLFLITALMTDKAFIFIIPLVDLSEIALIFYHKNTAKTIENLNKE